MPTDPPPGLPPVRHHDDRQAGKRRAVRVLRLSYEGLFGTLVSDALAETGGGCVNQVAHPEVPHVGLDGV